MLIKYEDCLVDTETGSLYEPHLVPYKHDSRKVDSLIDFTSVSNRKQAEKMFSKEYYNPDIRTHWTNWAVEEITSVDPVAAKRFSALSKLILSRNFIFDTNKNIADTIGCSSKHLLANLRRMESHGLIRIRHDHSGGQSYKLIQTNPTLVFRTYIAQEREDHHSFGHHTVFNNLHADYIKTWLEEGIKKSSYI